MSILDDDLPEGPAQHFRESQPVPDVLAILPLRDTVVFPEMAAPVLVGQTRSIELVDDALKANRLVALVTQREAETIAKTIGDLYGIGTMAAIYELGRADDSVRLVVQGIERIRVTELVRTQPYLVARIQPAPEKPESGVELDALVQTVKDLFGRFVRLAPELSGELATAAERMEDARQLAYLAASVMPLPTHVRQELLEMDLVSTRLRKVIDALQHELAVRQLVGRITAQTTEEMSKQQREHVLRKHMESIQRELGDLDEAGSTHELRTQLEKLPMPDEARKESLRELDRLERTPEASPEHAIIRTYVEWIAKLPWGKFTGAPIDVSRARRVLDEDHYDLEKIKDRIVDHLAVKKLREERQAEIGKPARGEPILCFLGPPGVGKTSLGQSIARAMGRAFVHQSLGGIHDEAEIRGHRRTYIGAMPGRIMQALSRAEAADPVFVLDEIDKLGVGFHGDPSAALLEALDPAQNNAFVDTYLGVPFDLSNVLFICTANNVETIPPPLLDRMEVLQLAGYTDREKLQIAQRFLVPKQRVANGLRPYELVLSDETILGVIRRYTREAGVRNLERDVGTIARKAARKITEGARPPIHVSMDDLREVLGAQRFFDEVAERIDRPGVATGLSWTPAGGEMLFVEATMVSGARDRVILTGMLGHVMRESAEAALTYLRATSGRLGIDARYLRDHRVVHVHVPAGAIPKDGPSAGVTILTALASHALGRPIRGDIAMTGELTLRGKVLPVGGIKEKVLAAHRSKIGTIILPKGNEPDLDDVPEEVRRAVHFVLVDWAEDVLHEALGTGEQPRVEAPPSIH